MTDLDEGVTIPIDMISRRRVYFVGHPGKPKISAIMADLAAFAEGHCEVVGQRLGHEGVMPGPRDVDRMIVLGGDGTLIAVGRSLKNQQIPLIGVNLGKLGFLTEFSVDEFRRHFITCLSDNVGISKRIIFGVRVESASAGSQETLAINDCVIQMGRPFRMLTLGVDVDGEHLTHVRGDGLIVCSPTGSTAYNLSAGGPIHGPELNAIGITPLNAHSLTLRPIIVDASRIVTVRILSANEGSTAIIDGQELYSLQAGDSVIIQRHSARFMLVRHPDRSIWHNLVDKLNWGYREADLNSGVS